MLKIIALKKSKSSLTHDESQIIIFMFGMSLFTLGMCRFFNLLYGSINDV